MSADSGENKIIHLSELDEYLASRLLDQERGPVCFSVSKYDSQGNVSITDRLTEDEIEEGGIDFELSPSEYQSLDSVNASDFTKSTVYTSSAYEFFDFILMYFTSVDCLLDFNGSSWRIKILSFNEDK